jgi:hypothetical protein
MVAVAAAVVVIAAVVAVVAVAAIAVIAATAATAGKQPFLSPLIFDPSLRAAHLKRTFFPRQFSPPSAMRLAALTQATPDLQNSQPAEISLAST